MRASRTSFPVLLIASILSGMVIFGLSQEELRIARELLWGRPHSAGPSADNATSGDASSQPDAAGSTSLSDGGSKPSGRPTDGTILDVPRGSPDRAAIMDALRPTAEREYRAPVEFVVLELRRSETVVFASVQPQRPGGGRIDCGYDNCRPVGRMDAILQPDENGWRVVDVQTDVEDRWRMQYCSQLPVGLVRECD